MVKEMHHLETLEKFRQRTEGFSRNSLPEQGEFCTSPGLKQKVDETGRFKPYSGNTVIFRLQEEVQDQLEEIQTRLYRCCGSMFAEPLGRSTFHITLHDLNSAAGMAGPELLEEMRRSGKAAREIMKGFEQYFSRPLELRGTWVFNLVNTSIVLGFRPENEENCRRLMAMYQELQGAVFLPYSLTPHVTLAYYRPGVYDQESLRRLRRFLEEENAAGPGRLKADLEFSDLIYAEFRDMQNF